ncbi:Na(+)/H(+) antiporter subunit D [Algimonas porphyrae]|uniref:Na(+)/H(+) antiporter subunit D n=1 Tax=Algimonas porphyrae TaxID=1128113 RepID=A0ABQ5UWM0_9PROT|nr:Na(+)/H(+) antiporter subunit D [Algimonas porphyrae]GLQ19676.1 Na(+)/H(+) antiporter subunit D [Algimonas porphyrae]
MTDTILGQINPGLWVIVAGLICALMPANALRKGLAVVAPVFAAIMIFLIYDRAGPIEGSQFNGVLAGQFYIGDVLLTTLRIDTLSVVWGYLFCLAGFINAIYALHEKSWITDSSALVYTGAAVAGVLSGDMLTLFLFWEFTAISSVFLVWQGGDRAYAAGIRYLVIQVLSGVLLLAGAVIYAGSKGGDFTFGYIGIDSPGAWLLLIGMGIKAGFPMLHMWMQDAYPKASITGTVILSAFTTKFAIYALARAFPGTDILIWIGCIMTMFPVFFAVIENDLRRVLAYSLNNQLGFMVAGIGIGTTMAMNGVVGQVFVHVIFKSLLFMSIGAVIHRTGTAKASELGGLFRSMPYTTVLCLIGAGSIAAFPLLAAFVTKAMILAAAIDEHLWVPFAMMLFASAGVMEHSGIKVPHFTFFAHDSGRRVKEAPWNMLVAMSLAAVLCIVLAWPWGGYDILYSLMPYVTDYKPYTWDHVVFQLQLLFAAIFAFTLLKRYKLYPAERRAEIVDVDVLYRKLGRNVAVWADAVWVRLSARMSSWRKLGMKRAGRRLYQAFSPAGALSQAAPSGLPAVLTAAVLVFVLIFAYVAGT